MFLFGLVLGRRGVAKVDVFPIWRGSFSQWPVFVHFSFQVAVEVNGVLSDVDYRIFWVDNGGASGKSFGRVPKIFNEL